MDRKKLSGAGYRLKAKEKARQIADIVVKTKNIKHFFLFQPLILELVLLRIRVRN